MHFIYQPTTEYSVWIEPSLSYESLVVPIITISFLYTTRFILFYFYLFYMIYILLFAKLNVYIGRDWSCLPPLYFCQFWSFFWRLLKSALQSHGIYFSLFPRTQVPHPFRLNFLATYVHIMPLQEKSEVLDGKVEEELQLVDGKVDWKGRRALRNKHGGMNASLLILGND